MLGFWVALPLVPAILIYRLFPDTQVAASGPLAGLTVKASGAFAAYLIVFLFIFALVSPIRDAIGSGMRPFWEIHRRVKLVDQDGIQADLLGRWICYQTIHVRGYGPDPSLRSMRRAGKLTSKVRTS